MNDKLLNGETRTVEAIVRVLEEAGIDMVFGIAGGNMGRLYDALYDHQGSIRTVLVRHEQLASVMAEAYGRLTGKPGVAIGQGIFILANGLLGTLEAHFGSSPMLLLTDFSDVAPYSKHSPYQSGTGDYGSADTRRTLDGVTKQTFVANEPAEAVQATQLAIKHALSGERGPIGVLYHSRVFKDPIDPAKRPFLYATKAYLPKPMPADAQDIAAAAKALLAAKRPVIIAGNGVRIASAYAELQALAELVAAPVATTASGKGTFAETHAMALGVCGNFGQATANAVIGEADLVLAVGSRLGPADTANENPQLIDPGRQTLLQIDVEPRNASWSFPCDVAIVGDAKLALAQLSEAIRALGAPKVEALAVRRKALEAAREKHGFFRDPGYASDEAPVLPQRIFAEVLKATAPDALFACDAGENRLFMTHYFQTKAPGSLLMPGIGAMGYAVPAALAGKLVFDVEHACQHLLRAVRSRAGRDRIAGLVGAGARQSLVREDHGAAASIADGNIETSELPHDVVDGVDRRCAACQVGLDAECAHALGLTFSHDGRRRHRRALELVDLGGAQVPVDDGDVGAEAGEPQRVTASQSARTPGDDGNLAGQLALAHAVSSRNLIHMPQSAKASSRVHCSGW
jgi:acetolactate synthase-1/2/3 large subunit